MMNAATVYIPCHNAEGFLRGCVRSLLDQTIAPAEILVVNDGSTDRTREVAAGLPVRVIDLDGHPGLAAARNAGVRAAHRIMHRDLSKIAMRPLRRDLVTCPPKTVPVAIGVTRW